MGPQQMKMSLTTTIKEENGAWSAVDTMETPMGIVNDASTIEKGTLIARSRKMQQGPMKLELAYTDGKVTGVANMGSGEKPIDAESGGPLFGEGPGGPAAIGCLPLKDGYSATFRNFDTQKMKAKLMQLKVAGSESVTTPAGKFDAYKVEVTSADGGNDNLTLWIAKDSRVPVKIATVLAAMGGATMTAEMLP
jgi:hypothetical protein